MLQPELLAPAGDLEKLETALAYGADAVYVGGEKFGLRAAAGNFSRTDLVRAVELTHARGKRIYLTLNAYLRPPEMPELADYLEALRPLALDAYIVADPGVLAVVRRLDPQRPVHLSTQANMLGLCRAGAGGVVGPRAYWELSRASAPGQVRDGAPRANSRSLLSGSGMEVVSFVRSELIEEQR
jgi:putative protease